MTAPVTVVALHGLGLSATYWDRIAEQLDEIELLALDLPGFGGIPALPCSPDMVGLLTSYVIERIAAEVTGPWLLLGHSMGGKIASCVAARALRGEDPVFGLLGVVLLAPSPPTPEPMHEDRRQLMLSWAADGSISHDDAQTFIDQNVGSPLAPADATDVHRDVERSSPTAWRDWLAVGSKQDVSASVGVLDLPAVILGGSQDDDLGARAQPGLHQSVYPRADFETVQGAGHLLALERPDLVATRIAAFVDEIEQTAPIVPAEWIDLIRSPRTIPAVRRVLALRAIPDDPGYQPVVLSPQQLDTLRLLADLVVPQTDPAIDVASRVDAQLSRGEGDGWRPDGLPADPQAYRIGLDCCAEVVHLDPEARQDFVDRLMDDDIACARGDFDGQQLSRWFEDARVDLIRQWLAHPANLARIGFDGFATGALDQAARGFADLTIGRREQWEPSELGSR